jgi:hypothetical protein
VQLNLGKELAQHTRSNLRDACELTCAKAVVQKLVEEAGVCMSNGETC